tara:strand:- start:987 stop:1217 length:231 start_codon:yes stop_codon:yes gene_type:complete
MFELRNVDTKLLREQREALLVSIDAAERGFGCPDGVSGEKQILMLDGLVGMIDDMLDAIEFSRPPEMAEYPIRGGE